VLEEARKVLDLALERIVEAMHHYEGTVNQVMGDGIMVLFGAPLAHNTMVGLVMFSPFKI
jgi:class 3 adenylate cyclase